MTDELKTTIDWLGTVAMSDNDLRQAYGAAMSQRNVAERTLIDANKEVDALHFEMQIRGLLPYG